MKNYFYSFLILSLMNALPQFTHASDLSNLTKALKNMPANVKAAMLKTPSSIPNSDGWVGLNKQLGWVGVGAQRGLGLNLSVAIADANTGVINRNLDAIIKTCKQMRKDGTFPLADGKEEKPPVLTNENLSFLSEIIPALIQLSTAYPIYNDQINSIRFQIEAMAKFSFPYYETVIARAGDSANWIFRDARTWILLSQYLSKPEYATAGKKLLTQALTMLQPNGILLEAGGGDTGYQSVSMRHLEILYYFNFDTETMTLSRDALVKSTQWYVSKFRADGKIDVTENTRTGIGHENKYGKEKEGNAPTTTVMVLALMGDIAPELQSQSTLNLFLNAAFTGEKENPRESYIYKGKGDPL